MIRNLLFLFTFLLFSEASAQFIVQGKVTDAETGDPIPFASVLLKGTTLGMNTDFEGNYSLSAKSLPDSIVVSYIGYLTQSKPLSNQAEQTLNFQLRPSDFQLEAFVFEAGENPAFEIIRKAVAKKKNLINVP
ncbi:carboxypeptidase-like regulatory domain-containing protein [Algoriphagus halophilus]|uniref:carboxypeptidase-like regulatory domain-containing protein n=1 Tax=Algoriphagus halophilus TaxID=226505 RepID=UPI00358E070B